MTLVIFLNSYIRDRIFGFFFNTSIQVQSSLEAINKGGLIGVPLLNAEVVLGLKPPGLTDPPRLGNLVDCFSITTEFFP